MKILYAGYGPMGILGLINIFSENVLELDSVFVLDPESVSDQSSLIYEYAKKYSLKIINEVEIEKSNQIFDLIVSVHWRKKIGSNLINNSKMGGINLHPSLLPKYAGCSSLAWALIYKEKKVGFTWHLLNEEFDTGDIVLQKKIDVKKNDNAFSLWNKVNLKGVNCINDAIKIVLKGKEKLNKQDLTKRSYFKRGFPTFEELKNKFPKLKEDEYNRASYFPGKS